MKCSQCGTDNPTDAKICSFCSSPMIKKVGMQLNKTSVEVDAKNIILKCPSCGTDNSKDAKICCFCSSPLASHLGTPFGETEIQAPQEVASFSGGELIANRYQIIRELGRGGMGVVYYVKDTKLENKEMALKMISPSLVKSSEVLKRFIREVLTAQELQHKNIVRVFHLDESDGAHFFTMEYLPGQSLREFIVQRNNDGRRIFSLKESISIIDPMLSALSHAHSRQVIHRDLKPENIIVVGDFPEIDIKVVDFGLARIMSPSRMTSSAMSMGTAYYMSPEQLSGKGEVDERSDIFAIGVIFYELLTGIIPSGLFKMPSVVLPGLPKEVDEIIGSSLATEPEDRYQSIKQFRKIFSLLLETEKKPKDAAEKQHEAEQRQRTAEKQKIDEERRRQEEEKKRQSELETKKQPGSRKAITVSVIGVVIVFIFISLIGIINNHEPETPLVRDIITADELAPTSPIVIPNNSSSRTISNCFQCESDAKNIAGYIADWFAIPTHTKLPTKEQIEQRGFRINNEYKLYGDPGDTITIEVKDNSGRCPEDYREAHKDDGSRGGWSNDWFIKRIL